MDGTLLVLKSQLPCAIIQLLPDISELVSEHLYVPLDCRRSLHCCKL